ncbi:MAG: carbohydrate kinase family protein [Thermaerobacter sp.]|nr:carbohydrate kinase family protein [Thermaerobacter sp.]
MQVLLIGPAFLDVIAAPVSRLPQPGEELPLSEIALAPGGFAIAAVALRRLGITAGLAAPIGDDGPGKYLRLALSMEGVPLEGAGAGRTPTTIALNTGGDRAFLTAGFPQDPALREVGLAALRRHPECRMVHLSCRGPFAEDVARAAKAEGRYVSVDCGTDPPWLRSEGMRRVLQLADLYLPNAREAAYVTGEEDPRSALGALLGLVPQAIVKLGAQGVLLGNTHGISHHPTTPREALDATGAGDVFDAGYIAGGLNGFDDAAAIRLGQYAAGCAIAGLGGASTAPYLAQARSALGDLPWPRAGS